MKKTKTVIRGNTVYEIDKYTKQPKHIIHGKDRYFQMRHGEYEPDEEYEVEEEPTRSPAKKHMDLLKLMGNKKKLVSKADGLAKEIAIVDIEPEEEKKEHYNRYRKTKKSAKPKRKVKKCRCKK
jgi:hypothetical protein